MSIASFFVRHRLRLLTAFLLAAFGLVSYYKILEIYELQTYDWRCQNRGARPVSDRIVFIDIASDAVADFGPWPFNREFHSNLIDYLSQCGAKAVIFDLLFVNPKTGEDGFVVKSAQNAANVYFPTTLSAIRYDGESYNADSITEPMLAEYAAAAKGIGFVNTKVDVDGKRRRVIPMVRYRGKDHLQLSLKVAADVLGVKSDEIAVRSDGALGFGERLRIPLDEDGCLVVSYASGWEEPRGIKHVSYRDALLSYVANVQGRNPILAKDVFENKICVVGVTLPGLDAAPIPIQPVYPMVGLIGNTINTVLTRDFIYRPGRFLNLGILFLLAWLVFVLTARFKPVQAFLAVTVLIGLFTAGSVAVFNRWGLWIDLFLPVQSMVVFYAVLVSMRRQGVS